ncbi:MAG TPA: isochorismatase family cysteine hydrolase [Steroidobacteraceae bacterium]|jgi:nicotinamidase-related amidase|nr:isochorismatase family cysteine hydrolase [Steroidobacteraceae bacterium]
MKTSGRKLRLAKAALLIIDMISDFEFEDGAAVARAALPLARTIAKIRAVATARGAAVLFVNDNLGDWHSDFRQMLSRCRAEGCIGAAIIEALQPSASDYFVLKPTHAGFYGTPLDHLLDKLGVETLVITGISAHQCILFTANEAYLRQYKLVIPSDCVAAKTSRQKQFALEYFKSVLHADTRPSPRIDFRR